MADDPAERHTVIEVALKDVEIGAADADRRTRRSASPAAGAASARCQSRTCGYLGKKMLSWSRNPNPKLQRQINALKSQIKPPSNSP